ncbi:DNA polymerase alpha/epsilon subunit B-domain-containing protein [Lyophyllum atratum]|nr:DNA polymerase alpha/epsilon subunit B-domain-containing protein [Lyophyllum atratum]
MGEDRQRRILKVFRKYSYSLGRDVSQMLEKMLEEHQIADQDVESAIEAIALEYSKQEDVDMKVNVEILSRVYESMRDPDQRPDMEKELIDPESHLFFINAFEMPSWHWSQENGTFTKGLQSRGSLAIRDRLNIIKQCVLRNEHFAPSTLPSRDRERLVTLKSTKQLLGRAGQRFLLLGMLTHNKEGRLCIEDSDGSCRTRFFEIGSFALVEGEYTEEATLEIIAIGQPPCEPREISRSIYGHIDFLGKGSTSLLEDSKFSARIQEELPDLHFFFLSDVWLDHPQTLIGIQKMFDNCVEESFIPKVIVLCGNFTRQSISHGNSRDVQAYQENFEALADLIVSYPLITTVDPLLPKVHFATNPCRIKFFDQEIVIFREDTMSRMLRNVVGVKPNVSSEHLKRYLVQTILDQAHLSPLTINVQPTLADYDHSLRLYPLPTALVLADKYDRYKITYTGCHVFNPGSFVGNSFVFSTYKPAEANSEECILDMDPEE